MFGDFSKKSIYYRVLPMFDRFWVDIEVLYRFRADFCIKLGILCKLGIPLNLDLERIAMFLILNILICRYGIASLWFR